MKDEGKIKIKNGEGIRFVVPQKIAVDDGDIYLRVLEPGMDKKIIISDGKSVFKTKKFKRVAPPEMIKIKLKKNELEGVSEITVSVK